jgi:hypothetical protein
MSVFGVKRTSAIALQMSAPKADSSTDDKLMNFEMRHFDTAEHIAIRGGAVAQFD